MANSYVADPDLPDARIVIPGSRIESENYGNMAVCLNYAMANVGAGVVAQQSWINGECQHEGPTPLDEDDEEIPIAYWQIPRPSTGHDTVSIYIKAQKVGAGAGTVSFFSAQTGLGVNINPGADPTAWNGPHSIPFGGNYFDIVSMFIDTDVGTSVIVYNVAIIIEPIDSPLPAESIVSQNEVVGYPLPVEQLSANGSVLPSYYGRLISRAIGTARSRWDYVLAVSKLNEAYPDIAEQPNAITISWLTESDDPIDEKFGQKIAAASVLGSPIILPVEVSGEPPIRVFSSDTKIESVVSGVQYVEMASETRSLIADLCRKRSSYIAYRLNDFFVEPTSVNQTHSMLFMLGPNTDKIGIVTRDARSTESPSTLMQYNIRTLTGDVVASGQVGFGGNRVTNTSQLSSALSSDEDLAVHSGEILEIEFTTNNTILFEAHVFNIHRDHTEAFS